MVLIYQPEPEERSEDLRFLILWSNMVRKYGYGYCGDVFSVSKTTGNILMTKKHW